MINNSSSLLPVPTVLIRYDGMDATRHQIDMADLAESMNGFSKILTTAGNFLLTGNYVKHRDAMAVRMLVGVPEEHCFHLTAALNWVSQNPLIASSLGPVFGSVITYIFTRSANKREEMRNLRLALETAIRELGHRDDAQVSRVLDTVDRMTDSLRGAARLAVSPIGRTASKLTVGDADPSGSRVVIEQPERDAIFSSDDLEVGSVIENEIFITELDLINGSCKFNFAGDSGKRIAGRITDPALMVPRNPYTTALTDKISIRVVGKPLLKNGDIDRLVISDSLPPKT